MLVPSRSLIASTAAFSDSGSRRGAAAPPRHRRGAHRGGLAGCRRHHASPYERKVNLRLEAVATRPTLAANLPGLSSLPRNRHKALAHKNNANGRTIHG